MGETDIRGGDKSMINITVIPFKRRLWYIILSTAKLIDGLVYLCSATIFNTCYFERLMLTKFHESLYKEVEKR